MELLIWIFLIFGLVGALLPAIPGPIFSSVGLILALIYCELDGSVIYLMIAGGFVIFCLDLVLPAIVTKKYGASNRAANGATIGMLLSLFTGPGMVLGAFIGAFIGEFTITQNTKQSSLASVHTILGIFSGILIKAMYALSAILVYVLLV
jgi:uncharacterized protein